MRTRFLFLIFILSLVALSGCTARWQELDGVEVRRGVTSSLVDFLYPSGEVPPKHDKTFPILHIPLIVGLGFVPSGSFDTPGLTEAHKAELLEKVKAQFKDKEYIREISIIPGTHLRSSEGFENVDRISRLYNLDVLALVSYDQVVHSGDTKASFFYWTMVGAYLIKGSKNDVQTFVDTSIFDVKTHKLLLRASGIDKIEATSTLINSVEDQRKNREAGFENAIVNMIVNLEKEQALFRERIKKDKSVTIIRNH